MTELYEVWVVIDSQPKSIDEAIVAVFTTEENLLTFVKNGKPFFDRGRFVIQARVSVDPNSGPVIVEAIMPKRIQ